MSNIEAHAGMLRLAADYEVMAQRAQEWSDSPTHLKGGNDAHPRGSTDVVFRAFDQHRGFTGSRM